MKRFVTKVKQFLVTLHEIDREYEKYRSNSLQSVI